MRTLARRTPRAIAIAMAVATAGTVVLAGCGDDETATDPELEEEVADVRGSEDLADPYTGVYDEQFAEDIEAYHGQEVTLRGDVGEVLGPSTFTLTAPGGEDVTPLLVVSEQPVEDLTAGGQVTVAATPQDDFDPAEVGSEFDLELGDEAYEEWDGDTYVTAVEVQPA
ncbi:hypothetical protein [Blastococcus saxobsidens]|uniref:Lipoprotein n=1 Tax=Blastococcus saxobsidens TaxID=138336 RepID=A0A4Q7Y6I2_9ACTN|nr:hypothetical protein [Blastococcus saxobsidens]RZU31549.1 hypothetical protein BKA19_1219 [Blastococcus saxobsidens]